MNQFFKLGTMLTIVAGAAMTISSCSSNDAPEFDPNAETKWNFQTEFVKQFGEIASNQNWGFNSVGVYTMPSSTRSVIKTDMPDYQKYEPAPDVTEAQINEVKDAFQNINNLDSEPINYTSFFVQQVYMSNRTYKDGNNQDVVGSSKMNHLKVWKDNENGEHANDFNVKAGTTVLFVNAGTYKFSYSNSSDSGKDYFDYIVKKVGGYYYVGFSFKANGQNPNEKVEGDNNYDDWIVRIVPAKMKGEEDKNTQRIIVEDLGSIGDFDYNDLVFDAYVYNQNGQTWAKIKLLAAGGTLPVYICGCDEKVEVHDKFGVSTTTMVNTKKGTVDKSYVEFTIKLKNQVSSSFNANDIEVKVDNNGNVIPLTSNVGKAPEKICVDNSFVWCDEKVNVKTVYPNFSRYVSNPSIGKWW